MLTSRLKDIAIGISIVLGILACENESQFNGSLASNGLPIPNEADATGEKEPVADSGDDTNNSDSSGDQLNDSPDQDVELSTTEDASIYSYGTPDPSIDYLFVIDNSSSMVRILSNINQGFASLEEAGVFPVDPRSLS